MDVINSLLLRRNIISHALMALGGLVAAVACYLFPWFGLRFDNSRHDNYLIELVLIPMGLIVVIAAVAAVVREAVRYRSGDELHRISDLKPIALSEDSITRILKISYFILAQLMVLIGGYFTVSIHVVIIFYFINRMSS